MVRRNLSMLVSCLTFVLILVFSRGALGDGGVKVVLTKQGLEYAASEAVEILSRKVPNSPLDDVQGSGDVAVGKVDYEINHAMISSFTKPSARVTVNTGEGLTMSLIDGGVSTRGDWRYKFKKGFLRFSDSGSFTASANGISISVFVSLGKNPNGSPSLSARDCRCSMSDVNFRLSGGASWLYNLFLRFYKDKIRSFLERLLCKEAEESLNRNGVEELATLNLQAAINDFLILDYRLATDPVFANDFMESNHVGRFLNDEGSDDVLSSMTSDVGRMISVSISDTTFNSASRVLYKNNKFRFQTSVSTNVLTDMVVVVLNNTEMPFHVTGVGLSVSAASPPKVSLESGRIALVAEAEGNIDVLDDGGDRATAISLKIAINYQIGISLVGDKLVGSVIDLNTTLTHCSLTVVNLSKLNEIIGSVIDIMKPTVEEALAVGFPLPNVEGVVFQNPLIQIHHRHVIIATDVIYRR